MQTCLVISYIRTGKLRTEYVPQHKKKIKMGAGRIKQGKKVTLFLSTQLMQSSNFPITASQHSLQPFWAAMWRGDRSFWSLQRQHSNFQVTVASNYAIAIASLTDWPSNLALTCQPMRSKSHLVPTIFPALWSYRWLLGILISSSFVPVVIGRSYEFGIGFPMVIWKSL